MKCDPKIFEDVPFFSLLDEPERAVLADQVTLCRFRAKQRIYKAGDDGGKAYVVVSGRVNLLLVDEDKHEITVDSPGHGEIFGLASLLDESPHRTTAIAIEETVAIEITHDDLTTLLQKKPEAGLDLLAMVGKQFHAAQHLVRTRATKNPNEEIEERETFGERVADQVAKFGGSWAFIIIFAITLTLYSGTNVLLGGRAWDPYPFILLNLFLSMLAAIQAPVIMMSQNRQDAKDRLRSELDYRVNLKAELEISTLLDKVDRLQDSVDELRMEKHADL
ncbi:MAG: DUF1003 domain-containing protein [Bdellovibrionota bacterium]